MPKNAKTRPPDPGVDTSRAVWVITDDARAAESVAEILKQFGTDEVGKTEFKDVEILRPKPDDIRQGRFPASDPVAVVTEASCLTRLLKHLKGSASPPGVLVVLDRFDAAAIEEAYAHRYVGLRGVFRKKSFLDPEERGVLARAIKEAVRSHPAVQSALRSKAVGWKIPDDPARVSARRSLVSLMLDRRMRELMQRLTFSVDQVQVKMPDPPDLGDALLDLYWDMGAALRLEDANARRQALRTLRSRITPYLANTSRAEVRPHALLLEGETGTGKTLVARWLAHQLTGQDPVQISAVNLSEELLEVELFGTIAGAFTDAVSRPGALQLAWGRVVFLDEIGDAPARIQAKLLLYLDTFRFRPRGWPYVDELYAPAYVVAATNRDLRALVRTRDFREDLYYRFRHRLVLPPLRERREDLRILIDFVLQDPNINPLVSSRARRRLVKTITVAALEKLEHHGFPGNFRELEDVLARAVFSAVRAGRDGIVAEDVQPTDL